MVPEGRAYYGNEEWGRMEAPPRFPMHVTPPPIGGEGRGFPPVLLFASVPNEPLRAADDALGDLGDAHGHEAAEQQRRHVPLVGLGRWRRRRGREGRGLEDRTWGGGDEGGRGTTVGGERRWEGNDAWGGCGEGDPQSSIG